MIICHDQRSGSGCRHTNPGSVSHCQQCGRSLKFALQLHDPGDIVGPYHIGKIIGHGGFGAVYQAQDRRQTPALTVALKETLDPDNTNQFRNEFQLLQQLTHDNLPRYFDMFEADGSGYLVMEFVPGQSLQEIVDRKQGPLTEQQVLAYVIQLCSVLHYLHQQQPPIFHRDIKPANIRLTNDGLIKLVDFGLFKQGFDTTRSSRRAFTPAYAPIEQCISQSSPTDHRTDIYSLGATLYHLLTGRPPSMALERISADPDPLKPPQQLNPHISDHVSTAILHALQRNREDRYNSIIDLRNMLLNYAPNNEHNQNTQPNPDPNASTRTVKHCPTCGKQNANDEIYCQHCGNTLKGGTKPCRHCQQLIHERARFCNYCGRPAS